MDTKRKLHGTKKPNRQTPRMLIAVLMLLAMSLLLIVPTAQAASYYFAVPKSTADVYVNSDGTVTIDYLYVFVNQPGASPIEYVDIGMPTTSYDLNSISGTVNGQPVRVENSTEVKGIALNLGNLAIPPGQQGEVRAHIPGIQRMLFKADAQKVNKQEAYGSFQFEPNFFGSQYVTGQTDMTVTLHLPAGMNQDEPVYFQPQNWPGQAQPEAGFDANGSVFYRWQASNTDISSQYIFGSAFPARLVPSGTLLTAVPSVNINLGNLFPLIFCLGFALFLFITIRASLAADRNRKLEYLPPRISVEGNGIKRGLTAVEAAILMGQPMDKILTMILFSVIKKNAAEVVSQQPMQLKVTQPLVEGLNGYENDFLSAMAKTSRAEQRTGLQDMMAKLVKSVSEKMRGFSRKETVAYYQDIMNKAWQQVEEANTPELKMQSWDDALDWTMLDKRFNDRTREVFGPQPVFVPVWWGRFNPGFGGMSQTSMSSSPSVSRPSTGGTGNTPPQGVSLPSLPGADFAGSLANGMQNFSTSVVGNLTAFTGAVTNQTNPPPPPTPTRSGGGFSGGGGRSCACACACAGCACACAGGGR